MTKVQMTKAEIFSRLIQLAQRGHHTGLPINNPNRERHECPWPSADLVAQEALYEISNELMKLLLEIGESMNETAVGKLCVLFPWAYKQQATGAVL